MATYEVTILGKTLHCSACETTLQYLLQDNKFDGFTIENLFFSEVGKQDSHGHYVDVIVQIETNEHKYHNKTKETLENYIQESSYTLVKKSKQPPLSRKPFPFDWIYAHLFWLKGFTALGVGVVLLGLSLLGITLPFYGTIAIAALATVLTLVVGKDSFLQGLKFKWDMDTLFTISTLTALTVSIASFFVPWLPVMFEAGLLTFGFRELGKSIERSIKEKIVTNQKYSDRFPKHVTILDPTTQLFKVQPLSTVKKGDILRISPQTGPDDGWIPVDGKLLTLQNCINTVELSGENKEVLLNQYEPVLAGMRVVNEYILVEATSSLKDSYIAKNLDNLGKGNSQLEETAHRITRYFIPIILIVAVATLVLIPLIMCHFYLIPFMIALPIAVKCVVGILSIACPCVLGSIVPTTLVTTKHKGEQYNVRFKNSQCIDVLARAKTLVIDASGTITKGTPEVSTIHCERGIEEWQFLAISAAMESQQFHTTAQAICTFARKKNIQIQDETTGGDTTSFSTLRCTPLNSKTAQEYQLTCLPLNAPAVSTSPLFETNQWQIQMDTHHHAGIKAIINGQNFFIGNQTFMKEKCPNLILPSNLPTPPNTIQTITYLASDNEILGYFVVTDRLRRSVPAVFRKLQQMGINVVPCTGIGEYDATQYLQGLPMHGLCVNATIDGKKEFIQKNFDTKTTIFVGDGTNDAAAMNACSAGISIGSTSSAEQFLQNRAQISILGNELTPLVSAIEIARQTVTTITSSILLSLFNNFLMVGSIVGLPLLAAYFLGLNLVLPPGLGPGIMIVQVLLICAVLYYFRQRPLPHEKDPAFQALQQQEQETPIELLSSNLTNLPKACISEKKTVGSTPQNTTLDLTKISENGYTFYAFRQPTFVLSNSCNPQPLKTNV